MQTSKYRARICKRLRIPGIDSKESIPGRYVKQSCWAGPPGWEPIPGPLKRFTNSGSGDEKQTGKVLKNYTFPIKLLVHIWYLIQFINYGVL
jgi:hypothetical protein